MGKNRLPLYASFVKLEHSIFSLPVVFAGALLELDLVTKRNRRDERFDFVKAIATTAENFQRKIDLRGSDDLHISSCRA